VAILVCSTVSLQYNLFPSELTDRIAKSVTLFGMTLAITAIFTFSLEYSFHSYWINRSTFLLFAIIPITTQFLYWVPESVLVFQKQIPLPSPFKIPGFLENINLLYWYSLLIITVLLLGWENIRRPIYSHARFWSMLTGPFIALMTVGIWLLDFYWTGLEEILLLAADISVIGFTYNTFHFDLDRRVIRRRDVFGYLEDGWIVLDSQDSIVDFNKAVSKLVDIPPEEIYNKSFTSVFGNYPSLVDLLDAHQEMELDKAIDINNEYRYLNIRATTIKDDKNTSIGRLLLWRDITDRRREEDARQQARDEMFVLLNAISNSASQTANLSEFLSDVMYQIIYPFHSQILIVYILDDRLITGNKDAYYLAAHLGLSPELAKELAKLSSSSPLVKWIDENDQHVLLEDPENTLIPEQMRALNTTGLLVIPLMVHSAEDKKLIGLLFLGRKTGVPYKPDDIVRLSILADQIANLVDSDRRRKLAISLSERQRLMRDVHDSLSQKLYGLVTLTEAAEAAREAGADVDYGHFLSRISENARQAVKELRLFLFQMQPIDLEKEGLISVLHHRLAAVEGRADIKARFLADEPIDLSPRKELALYYIAQEALNNVLRHAFAKSVSVTLKQAYKYVTLEITDDGCGFDKTKLERGGMGLKNITERVKQENGKVKISSKPGKGTIIRVTFEKDSVDKTIRKR
jgi:PAS domain S-box-containing protein